MIVFKKLYPLDSKGLRPSKGKVHLMTFCMWIKCCTFLPSKASKSFCVFSHSWTKKLGCGENRRTIRKGRGEGWWKILDRNVREKHNLLKVGKVERERECQRIEKKKGNCD